MTSHAVTAARPVTTTRLRLVPAPQPGVPYDDERPAHEVRAATAAPDRRPTLPGMEQAVAIQGTLALAFPLSSGAPAVPTPSPRLRIVGRALAGVRHLSVVPDTALSRRPDASRWAALIAQAIVEAEVGDRPVSQLVRWTTSEVHDAIAARCSDHARRDVLARRSTTRAQVASIHLCQIDDDTAEVCATVRWAGRARAIALRLEAAGDSWRCTAVSLG